MDLQLISEVIASLKESLDSLQNSEISVVENDKIKIFFAFLKDKIFAKIPNGNELYLALESNINDKDAEKKISVGIEQILNKNLRKEIEDHIVELHKHEDLEYVKITQTESTIVVAWDFTVVSEYALEHAVMYSKTIKGKIILLHILKKAKEEAVTIMKLNEVVAKTEQKYGIKPDVLVRVGTIFTEISAVSKEVNADLVIMGTHGVKGMQKLTGSWALKVIANTTAPFIVVQKPPTREKLEEVLFPIDSRKAIKQKLNQARYLAHFCEPTFHLCYPETITLDTSKRKTHNNLRFIEGYFDKSEIKYKTHKVEGTTDFGEATTKLAKTLNPDLIIILVTIDIGLANYMFGAEEQKIIANPMKLPVMCVNPKHVVWSTVTR